MLVFNISKHNLFGNSIYTHHVWDIVSMSQNLVEIAAGKIIEVLLNNPAKWLMDKLSFPLFISFSWGLGMLRLSQTLYFYLFLFKSCVSSVLFSYSIEKWLTTWAYQVIYKWSVTSLTLFPARPPSNIKAKSEEWKESFKKMNATDRIRAGWLRKRYLSKRDFKPHLSNLQSLR